MEAGTKPSLWLRIGLPVAVVAAAAFTAHAYDTSWIASGQPVSAMSMKTALDEVQSRLVALEGRNSTRVYRTSDQSIANATDTAISFDTIRFDYGNEWTSANPTRLTVSAAGVYEMGACGEFLFNATGSRQLSFRVNGTTLIAVNLTGPNSANTPSTCLTTLYQLAANDYVELFAYQGSGAALAFKGSTSTTGTLTGAYSAEFWIHRVR